MAGDGLPPPPPPPQSSAIAAASSLAPGQRPSPTTNDPSGRQRPTVYVAMFPYSPRKEDELELRKGEMFLVLERCQDGWFKGTSMHTGKMGVFPGNYMSPISRTGAGRGVTPSSPLTAPGAEPTPASPSSPAPCPLPPPPAPAVGPAQPAKLLMHMTVNQARNAVRTACCPGQDRPPAVMPVLAPAAYLPHLSVTATSSAPLTLPNAGSAPLTLPNAGPASLTLNNAGSASLDGETTLRPMAVPIAPGNTTPIAAGNTTPIGPPLTCRLDKKEKKGLLKLLSTKKKPRPSPPSSPTLESEQAAVTAGPYRAVLSYPPQSEAELELQEGDVVFVHRKREDGWFKGTLQRNGRTGLFPGSFVLSI
ncbi:hypothetical protein COCON_G00071150 [Conger conger]|uniref:RING-type E3 ubiquitin transferase n=1 Tax=Conger conger TaxID=82655 RepID=A0A9Q1DTT5_CONCO|nr:hypothetical protein COCON_G00071150 [Conger conger]